MTDNDALRAWAGRLDRERLLKHVANAVPRLKDTATKLEKFVGGGAIGYHLRNALEQVRNDLAGYEDDDTDTVIADPSLHELAERANAKHLEAVASTKTTVERWVEVGEILIAAKAKVGHGGWCQWVEENLRFGRMQASRYIRVARLAPELANVTSTLHLDPPTNLDEAVALLAAPPEPEDTGSGVDDEPSGTEDAADGELTDTSEPDPSAAGPPDLHEPPGPPSPRPRPAPRPAPVPAREQSPAPTDPPPSIAPFLRALSLVEQAMPADLPKFSAECPDPDALRTKVFPVYDGLRQILNSLDRRQRRGRPANVAQPLPPSVNNGRGRLQ